MVGSYYIVECRPQVGEHVDKEPSVVLFVAGTIALRNVRQLGWHWMQAEDERTPDELHLPHWYVTVGI